MVEEEELPFDVVEQILIRLDVKDLLRYKSVCKSWQSLISSPPFIKSHLNHFYVNDRHCLEFGRRKMIVSAVYKYEVLVVGSCNGLVCVSPGGRFELVVTNPSTREVKKLQTPISPLNTSICWGFGYDSDTDAYKVIVGFRKDRSTALFHVLTLKSNTWKVIGEIVNYKRIWDKAGILCDGALHWFMLDAKLNKVIISLDLCTHELKEIPLPAAAYDVCLWYKLGIIEKCLCMYQCRCRNPMLQKIWVKRSNQWEVYNDIDQESNIKYDYDVVHQLTILSRGVDSTPSQTTSYVYGIDDGRLVPGIGGDDIFVKSLVSPNPHPHESVESRDFKKRKRSI